MNDRLCRICYSNEDSEANSFVFPCYCSGSIKFVHKNCLLHWMVVSGSRRCEICLYPYDIRIKKLKPMRQWVCPEEILTQSIYNVMFYAGILRLLVIWARYFYADNLKRSLITHNFPRFFIDIYFILIDIQVILGIIDSLDLIGRMFKSLLIGILFQFLFVVALALPLGMPQFWNESFAVFFFVLSLDLTVTHIYPIWFFFKRYNADLHIVSPGTTPQDQQNLSRVTSPHEVHTPSRVGSSRVVHSPSHIRSRPDLAKKHRTLPSRQSPILMRAATSRTD